MPPYDWSKFCKRITIKASIQQVYDAWTTRDGLEKWFLRKAEFTKPDGTLRERNSPIQTADAYSWLWFGYGDDVIERGSVLEANGRDVLRFTFTANCLVMVGVKLEHGETIAELWQENIPVDDDSKASLHLACMKGWTFYLANLKSILEGGLDLRNKNVSLANVINA